VNDVCPLSALVLIPGTHCFPNIFACRPILASKMSTDRHIVAHLNSFGVFILHIQ